MRTTTRRGFSRDWCEAEAWMEEVGSEGEQSLFLFQLDRIGSVAQERGNTTNTELWQQGKGRLNPGEEERN